MMKKRLHKKDVHFVHLLCWVKVAYLIKMCLNQKQKKLIFCIVLNIHFPNIKIRFVRGIDLLTRYPKDKYH